MGTGGVQRQLVRLEKKIRLAFVYGSVAK